MKHSTFYKILITVFLIVVGIFIYARYYETVNIVVKENNVVNSNLPDSFYGYKIIQLSDIHYKTTIGRVELENIVNKVNKSKPNIIVITGDLLDKNVNYSDNDVDNIVKILSKLNCKYKYIITGDNDKKNIFENIVKKIGFKLLDNTYEILYNDSTEPLLIGGLSTDKDTLSTMEKVSSIETAIKNNNVNYSVLLIHEPNIINDIDISSYNLILAGHTLNGQINLPAIKKLTLPSKNKSFTKTYYNKGNTDIYISPGLGTANFKARLFNKPTINLYRLLNK